MVTETKIDNDNKIILRTISCEIDTLRALKLVQNVSLAVNLNLGYNILADIRATTFQSDMIDLLEIETKCSAHLTDYSHKIAFLMPDTEQRWQVAKLFRTCMEAQGFLFEQFIDYDEAIEWLTG